MKEKQTRVYRSKNQADWEKAQTLLREADIAFTPFVTQEVSGTGCGAKIDPRTFLNKTEVPKVIFHIDVAAADDSRAQTVLRGRVQPVLSYGYSI